MAQSVCTGDQGLVGRAAHNMEGPQPHVSRGNGGVAESLQAAPCSLQSTHAVEA